MIALFACVIFMFVLGTAFAAYAILEDSPRAFGMGALCWVAAIGMATEYGALKADQDAHAHLRTLPAHILAAPEETFYAQKGYSDLGVALCTGSEYTTRPWNNGEIIICTGGANAFRYPPNRRYNIVP